MAIYILCVPSLYGYIFFETSNLSSLVRLFPAWFVARCSVWIATLLYPMSQLFPWQLDRKCGLWRLTIVSYCVVFNLAAGFAARLPWSMLCVGVTPRTCRGSVHPNLVAGFAARLSWSMLCVGVTPRTCQGSVHPNPTPCLLTTVGLSVTPSGRLPSCMIRSVRSLCAFIFAHFIALHIMESLMAWIV